MLIPPLFQFLRDADVGYLFIGHPGKGAQRL